MTRELRKEINDLVVEMNGKIQEAVETVNRQEGFEVARFIDMDPLFENHRFCEGDQTEPSHSDDTWFFLLTRGDAPPDPNNPPVPPDLTPAECEAILAIPNPAMGQELGLVIWCGLRQAAQDGFAPPDWAGDLWPDNWDIDNAARIFHPKSRGYQAVKSKIEQELQTRDVTRLHPVLIMYSGSKPSFEAMISSLPALPGRADGRETRRWERDNHDLRGFSTWLTAAAGYDLRRDNPNVLGVSYEPRLVFNPPPLPPPPPPGSLQRRHDNAANSRLLAEPRNTNIHKPSPNNTTAAGVVYERDGSTSRGAGAAAGAAAGAVAFGRRQISTEFLSLQADPEENRDIWGLRYLSTPPEKVGVKYWKYPGYVHANEGGRNADIYILDTGAIAGHDVSLFVSGEGNCRS